MVASILLCSLPSDKGIVGDKGSIDAVSKFNVALKWGCNLVAQDIPGGSIHGLEAYAVMQGIGNAVLPDPYIDMTIIRLDTIIGNIKNIIAENITIVAWVGNPIGNMGDRIIGDGMVVGVL